MRTEKKRLAGSDRWGDRGSEVRLLLLAPGLDPKVRETVFSVAGTGLDTSDLFVVELVPTSQALRVGARRFLSPWPYRTEDLERQIRAALITGGDRKRASQGHG